MKKIIIKILTIKPFNKVAIKAILKMHQILSGLAGLVAASLEPDALHPKHRIMNYHKWFVDNIKPEWTVLDMGCGLGVVARELAAKAKKVVGIELNAESYQTASKLDIPNLDIIHGDATKYDFSHSFDAIVLSNFLEHIYNRNSLLLRLAKISSRLLIRVPMIDRDWITLYKKEMGLPWKLNSGHYTEYTLNELKVELESSGWQLEKQSIQYGEIWAVVKKK